MFAAGPWILGADSALQTDTSLGRHPTVTPPRTVRVVHAVRRPLAVPRAALQASRVAGDTGAALSDPAAPLLGVDRDSTVQVDVVASWDEWADSDQPTPMTEVVQSVPVGLTDAMLPVIRHEFGDTKYRHIKYQLTARSRFRQYFADTDPDGAFATTPADSPVDVLSTARPAPPVVVSIVPAFRWTDVGQIDTGLIDPSDGIIDDGHPQDGPGFETSPLDGPDDDRDGFETPEPELPRDDDAPFLHRERSGGRVRVELGRPWFTTGQGERLVVVIPSTAVYRDPLYAAPAPQQPIFGASAPGIPVVQVDDPDGAGQVSVALFDVRYENGRPFADVVLPGAASTYSPMARLVLARYQEHSLPGLHLSTTTTTEAVPVLPSRTLIVEREAGGVTVTLSGIGPTDVPNRVEARLEVAPSAGFGGTLSTLTDGVPAQGWQQVSTGAGVLGQALDPIVVPPDGRSYRLVIREFENLEPLDPPTTGDVLVQELGQRVVFADVVAL
jgi:hypothetical protein